MATFFVKTINGKTITLEGTESTTIREVKEKIFNKEKIKINEQRIIIAGKEISDFKTLGQYNYTQISCIHLVLRKPNTGNTMFSSKRVENENEREIRQELLNTGQILKNEFGFDFKKNEKPFFEKYDMATYEHMFLLGLIGLGSAVATVGLPIALAFPPLFPIVIVGLGIALVGVMCFLSLYNQQLIEEKLEDNKDKSELVTIAPSNP